MCKFYADNFTNKVSAGLNRSNSFSGSHHSSTDTTPERREGSFKLFRSNSWSSRRKKTVELGNEPILEEEQHQQQRSSPSYSTKSQDSGFSENAGNEQLRSTNSASQLIQNQRLQFLRSNMELREDERDPNLTQIPPERGLATPKKLRTINSASDAVAIAAAAENNNSKHKVRNSLSNIASLQAGLNIKRFMAENVHEKPLPAPTHGALNLLRPTENKNEKLIEDLVNVENM